ncbi:magnesium transporter [Chytriomyces sp. MP71]|nr:magnesium transporter [Chytriomyces sp. MP71]
MSQQIGGLILAVSLVLLAHAGFSAVEHVSFAKAAHADPSLPIDISAEVLVGLIASIVGVVLFAGNLKEVRMEKELSVRSFDVLGMTPSFRSVRHRGARIFNKD